ncbi:thioredoxin reductase [Gordonia iterans]|uniref:Thioredoxin reductase n=1 Tax=Gordonia iterans TaxID=1004901 RepID=A0A2S0KFD1_9ACTN|nr:NAD(P)/FAD-dependent oxidoreductase [Gordonia iterans]AVM00341.1 thioredoxin reductase [Gordonia iterans]
MTHDYEVLVLGGSAAGLSAGLTLARARRRIAVIDGGAPRNARAEGIHGLVAAEGIAPSEYAARGRAEVTGYGGQVIDGRVVGVARTDDGFAVQLGDGTRLSGRAVLAATGVRDELPAVPGLADHWGTQVLHCPYCHGWEFRDRRIAVLATGPMSWMQALLFRQWSADTVLLTNGVTYDDEALARVDAMGVQVHHGVVTEIVGAPAPGGSDEARRLGGVRLADGRVIEVDAVAVPSHLHANVEMFGDLGLEVAENEFGTYVPAGDDGSTAVPGLWVAGNLRDQHATVASSSADGVLVAARLNMSLIFADAETAVAAGLTEAHR